MKLCVSSSGIGPRVFTNRLVKFLKHKYGVVIDKRRPHIYLSSVWRGKPPKGAVTIHRLDGVYFNKDLNSAKVMNKQIASAVQKSDGVIYQSVYSKRMCKGVLGIKKKGVIIHNGFDPLEYEGITVDKMGYKNILVGCAKWRSLKRPRSIANGFCEANMEDTLLIMIGDIDKKDKIKHPNILYTGSVSTDKTYKYYISCDGLIHISRLDACPNVVVEALVAGKPVLCNNVGGTPEIVKDSGIVINVDPPLKYKMFSMGKPDRVNSTMIAFGMKELLSRQWTISRDDLTMEACADKYYKYFMEVLNKKTR